MDMDDVKFIKKKTSISGIEAHPTEDAVIVTYQIDASLMSDDGSSLMTESKPCQKIFKILNIDQAKDLDILSLELIKRSEKLVSYSQIDAVRQIIQYIVSRKDVVNDSAAKMENLRPKTAQIGGRSRDENEDKKADDGSILDKNFWPMYQELENQSATINDIDSYIEQLYEDIDEKLKGAVSILKLAQFVGNLGEMADNETLLCALTRVLREDGRKSVELATLIVAIFATFSQYHSFHDMITHYKIGSQTLDLIQFELNKEPWQESSSRQSSASSNVSNGSTKSAKKQNQAMVHKQNQLLKVSFRLLIHLSEDPKLELKMVKKGIIDHLVRSLERDSDIDLLTIVLNFLLKLSIYGENKELLAEKAIMEKMFILFSFASKCSDIDHNFMTAILSLVYNLSFDKRLVRNMVQVGMVSKLFTFWCRNKTAVKKSLEQVVVKILYQVSREPKVRKSFDFTVSSGQTSIDLFMVKVLRTLDVVPSNHRPMTSRNVKSLCPIELLTLAINLSLENKIAVRMAADGRLASLLHHVYERENGPLDIATVYTVKIIRNLSIHNHEYKVQFVPFVEKISTAIVSMEVDSDHSSPRKSSRRKSDKTCWTDDISKTFLTESLAILGNLSDESLAIEWFTILDKVSMFDWLMPKLTLKNNLEDDVLLELIIFLGTICLDEKCAAHFVSKDGMDLVTEMLDRMQEDDEIVLQTLFLIYVIAEHHILKKEMAGNTKLSSLLLELMNDDNGEIKKLASATLDIFSNSHQVWANKVRMESFRSHNQQWLQMLQSNGDDDSDDDPCGELGFGQESDPDLELYDVLRSELLNSSLDSYQGSNKSASPPSSYGDYDGKRPKTAQRPTTAYGRR